MPEPPRILIVINSLLLGGAEQQAVELALQLHGRGWRVKVATLIPGGEFVARLEQAKIPLQQLDWSSRRPLNFLGLIRIVRRFKPTVVHTHLAYANIASRLCRPFCSMPVLICTAHSVFEHSRRLDLRGKVLDLLYRLTDHLCDRTTIVCQAGAQRYQADRLVPAHRLEVVYNGIDTTRFQPRTARRTEERTFRWISVGRLSPVKDFPTMLRAFALCLEKAGPDQRLDIIGGGKILPELQELSRSLGLEQHVHFHGSRPDVGQFLSQSDAFLQSSEWEGFPIVLLESASVALPVVVTDVGGNREIVVDGQTGLLAPPRDPEALAQCMQKLLHLDPQERRSWGKAARDNVLRHFSMETITDQWEEIYRQMLEKKSPQKARTDSVRDYFNRIAGDYSTRYASRDPYYRYFFQERLGEALGDETGFQGKVLDIGAGTGPLYDQLQRVSPQVRYLGLDISEEMLIHSNIPPENRKVGEFPQATGQAAPFDRIYCLGVTTYLDPASLQRVLQGMSEQLEVGGEAIVTFTNRASIDSLSRLLMSKIKYLPGIRHLLKDRVFGQDFTVHEVSLGQLKGLLPANLELSYVAYLNHTLTPINRIFPRPSVTLGRFLHPLIRNIRFLGFLSTDFLVRLRRVR